jgi:NAD(P)-dependent dehydrogenase (short-subunit alcohol dehydrogenase family)
MGEKKIALVTGGNKGIGLEICRQLARKGIEVILTSRDGNRGEKAAQTLQREGLETAFLQLDVTDPESVGRCAANAEKKFGRLDILINNAGVRFDRDLAIMDLKLDVLRKTVETNIYGPFLVCQAFLPLMKKSGGGRIVNVSSGMGALAKMKNDSPSYRISKAGLNALTRIFADELKDAGILVNTVHPGWVKTEMGTQAAAKTVEEGADTPVWAALLPDGGPSGEFFFERKTHPW